MRTSLTIAGLLAIAPCAFGDDPKGVDGQSRPIKNEVVMPPGMRISATTPEGTITVTAVDELTRTYTWEGATRSVEMTARPERSYGSLGLYFPGLGEHWAEHHGITRGVLEEGQQHFKSVEEAVEWIRSRDWMPHRYRNDGLVVGWGKTLPRKQLDVDVWQILINGKKPEHLPGSQNDKILVETVQAEPSPLVQAVRKNDLDAVTGLLAEGSDPKTKTSVGTPLLVLASKRGLSAVVKALLKQGADVNARDEGGATALLVAVETGRMELVKLLLASGADVNARYQRGLQEGATPLLVAVILEKEEMVGVLIENGADAKAATAKGLTPLRTAKLKHRNDIVRRLEKAGADR